MILGGCIKQGKCDECGKKVTYPIEYPNLLWDIEFSKKKIRLCPKCAKTLLLFLNNVVGKESEEEDTNQKSLDEWTAGEEKRWESEEEQ